MGSSWSTLILTKMNGWQEKNPAPEFMSYSFIPIIFSKIMFSYIQEKIQTHATKLFQTKVGVLLSLFNSSKTKI